eukprot:1899805-Amphidinium_carterae.1
MPTRARRLSQQHALRFGICSAAQHIPDTESSRGTTSDQLLGRIMQTCPSMEITSRLQGCDYRGPSLASTASPAQCGGDQDLPLPTKTRTFPRFLEGLDSTCKTHPMIHPNHNGFIRRFFLHTLTDFGRV